MKTVTPHRKWLTLLGMSLVLLAMLTLIPSRALAEAPTVSYRTHVQTYGWQEPRSDGTIAGTVGESKRLEAICIWVQNGDVSGGITYQVHCQTYGWLGWCDDGTLAGTTGASKRLEAINMKLTGELAKKYDVWYRVHVQTYGWQSWRSNGALAGTTGESKRLEGIQIKLVEKSNGATEGAEASKTDDSYGVYIMGKSKASQESVVKHFKSINPRYPSDVYASKGAASIKKFVKLLFRAAESEGVRADVVYAQAMLETNYLRFGGDVSANQCNFAGIGAVGGGEPGNVFADVKTGLLAQVQHLKAYASTKPLNKKCVDPRFSYVTRGIAPTLGDLSKRWAVDEAYGSSINRILVAVDALG